MALASMTGFARTSGTFETLSWVFEIKSVNGRGLDMRFRLPPPFDILESELRGAAQKRLSRGNLQIGLTARRESAAAGGRINEALFLSYAEAAERMAWSAKLAAPTLGDILRLPGVVDAGETTSDTLGEAAQAAVLSSFDAAVLALVQSRTGEGQALGAIVSRQLDEMSGKVAEAETADIARQSAIKDRLKAQVQALVDAPAALDPDRLHQEAVLMASRMDVREELDRLKAHIEQARSLLKSGQAVGRKLDFLSQEFVRETNTLCSKANDLQLTRIGLDLKAIVEQFREQVQNIE